MLSVEQASAEIRALARPLAAIMVPLSDAWGHTLATDIASDIDSPPHDKSMVDGYAIRAADVRSDVTELAVIEEVLAGRVPTRTVEPGTSTRIMTGAPIPTGADAVVMIEHSTLSSGAAPPRVTLRVPAVQVGQNIMPRGQSLRAGATVLRTGAPIRAIEIGLLAEVGRATVPVVARPRVAILSTGDELVSYAERPGPGQIRNSNGPMLAALVRQAGGEPAEEPIVPDELCALEAAIARGLGADVLVLSGGVSAGVADLVPGVLAAAGVRQVFHKVHLRPGKPLWFGIAPRAEPGLPPRLVFGLPGNPVSSLVCFELFVRPALAVLRGGAYAGLRTDVGTLAAEFQHRGDRPTYYPARVEAVERGAPRQITLLNWQGSADLATLAQANALAHFPPGTHGYAAGADVDFLWL